jgi:hypothetical protein
MAAESQGMTKMCVPFGEMTPFELLNCVRIRNNGLFFKVTDETVASSRGNNIREDWLEGEHEHFELIRGEAETYKRCCKKRPARREQSHEERFQDRATS